MRILGKPGPRTLGEALQRDWPGLVPPPPPAPVVTQSAPAMRAGADFGQFPLQPDARQPADPSSWPPGIGNIVTEIRIKT